MIAVYIMRNHRQKGGDDGNKLNLGGKQAGLIVLPTRGANHPIQIAGCSQLGLHQQHA